MRARQFYWINILRWEWVCVKEWEIWPRLRMSNWDGALVQLAPTQFHSKYDFGFVETIRRSCQDPGRLSYKNTNGRADLAIVFAFHSYIVGRGIRWLSKHSNPSRTYCRPVEERTAFHPPQHHFPPNALSLYLNPHLQPFGNLLASCSS